MTRTAACKILGIPGSTSPVRAEQVYQRKRRQLQLQLMPGSSLAVRKKAQDDLALLVKAWQTYTQTYQTPKAKKARPANPRKLPQQPIVNLKDLWESIFGGLPWGKPVCIVIFLVFLCLLALIRSCGSSPKINENLLIGK